MKTVLNTALLIIPKSRILYKYLTSYVDVDLQL